MKTRYYVGDNIIPWWVEKLIDCGLITQVRGSAAITFFLVFKHTYTDSKEHYLYDGDFLELNEETGSVTIGYADWDSALHEDFAKMNHKKFVESLHKTQKDKKKKEQYEANYNSDYWA
jgi:hypothetical protein